jgi:hypothetical protein
VPPAHQGLDAGDVAAGEPDARLVVELELVGRQRAAQLELERAAGTQPPVDLRSENA